MKPAEILSEARALLDDAIQLRRRIHRHPEIGLTLPRTQATVLEALVAVHVAVALRFLERGGAIATAPPAG
jgi:hippurate hydrolase